MVVGLYYKFSESPSTPRKTQSGQFYGLVDTLRDAALIRTDGELTFAFGWWRPWWVRIAALQQLANLSICADRHSFSYTSIGEQFCIYLSPRH